MLCCGKKKKEIPNQQTNTKTSDKKRHEYKAQTTTQRQSQIQQRPEEVWEQIDPIQPPYPPGQTNLEEIIDHDQMADLSIKEPQQDDFGRQVGEWRYQ